MTPPGTGWRVDRVVDPDEIEAVAALEAEAFRRPVSRAGLDMALRSDVFRIYALRTPERPLAAFCSCSIVVDELHIDTVAVAPDCRRQGMATWLMEQVLAEAEAAGARRATLEVRVSNTAARQLYERLGFTVAAVRKMYYASPAEDGLILWRVTVS